MTRVSIERIQTLAETPLRRNGVLALCDDLHTPRHGGPSQSVQLE